MQKNIKWIWQDARYPQFDYDLQKVVPLLTQVAYNTGRLDETIALLDNTRNTEFKVESLTKEIITSNEIEGAYLNRESVRSSVCKKLDAAFDYSQDASTHYTDALVDILIDSNLNHEALTIERIHSWHHALFPGNHSSMHKINAGCFRDYDDMHIVSGAIGREKIHYVGLPHKRIKDDMDRLLAYINTSQEDPYIKSSISHLWFASIHPYDDGNGRIARVIADYVLSRELDLDYKYYSVSSAINLDRKGYYNTLEQSQNLIYNRSFDFTKWIIWHLQTFDRAIDLSLENINIVIDKTKFWDRVDQANLNERQIKVLNRLADAGVGNFEGGLTAKKYMGITKVSKATATRDIKELHTLGFIEQVTGSAGRNTRYDIYIH